MSSPSLVEKPESPYVSTGHLPHHEVVRKLVKEAHQRFKSNTKGENSQVYPALTRAPSELFGVCIVATVGHFYGAEDTDHEFSIMSVSKPFVFALICEDIGPEEARRKLGANATGLPFNSLAAIVRVNTEAHLRLEGRIAGLAGAALLAVIPTGRQPTHLLGELPSDEPAAGCEGST